MDKQVLRQVHDRPPSTSPTSSTAPTVAGRETPADDDVNSGGELRPKYRQLPLRFDDQVRAWQAPVALAWPGKQPKLKVTVLSDYFRVS